MNATFLEVYDKYLLFKKNNIEYGTYLSLLKLKDKIIKYEKLKKRILYLSDISLEWFIHFTKYMTNGKYGKCTNNTLKLYITLINSFLHQCKIFGYQVNDDYIKFREYIKNYKVPKYDRPVLLDEELVKLWNFKGYKQKNGKFIKITPYKKKTRDLFVFQCQVGFRWGDIARLKRRDIVEKNGKYYINNFTTQKRKSNVSVQLNQLAMSIINEYCSKFETMNYNRPIFINVPDCSNATHILKWIAEKCDLNRMILTKKGKLEKEIEYRKKISDLISTHFARSKFATDWITNGKDIYKLKIILGHSSVRTTERYIRTIPGWIPDGIETEMDDLMLKKFKL